MHISAFFVFLVGIKFCVSASFSVPKKYDGVYYRCVQNGTIALTFDDGPHENVTPGLLNLLQSLNVSATFFVVGWRLHILAAVESMRRTHREGHYVGSHTWNHADLTQLNKSQIISEMNVLSDKLSELINHRPKAMRPPYGSINDFVVNIVHQQLNYSMIMWSIDTEDWAHPGDTKAGLRGYIKVLEGTNPAKTPGFIALHHDPLEGSTDLASVTINYARRLGYRYVTLSECLDKDYPDTDTDYSTKIKAKVKYYFIVLIIVVLVIQALIPSK